MKRITILNRKTDKRVAMTKFDIAYLIDKVYPLANATIIYNHLEYKFLVEMLYDKLTIKRPELIELIDWKDYIKTPRV